MSMTRNDFELLARALVKSRPPEGCHFDVRDQWAICRADIANLCASVNARFDRAKFLTACLAEK